MIGSDWGSGVGRSVCSLVLRLDLTYLVSGVRSTFLVCMM